jgi:dsRNA-specific ribonuclease
MDALFGAIWIDSECDLDAVNRVFQKMVIPFVKKHAHPDKIPLPPWKQLQEITSRFLCSAKFVARFILANCALFIRYYDTNRDFSNCK